VEGNTLVKTKIAILLLALVQSAGATLWLTPEQFEPGLAPSSTDKISSDVQGIIWKHQDYVHTGLFRERRAVMEVFAHTYPAPVSDADITAWTAGYVRQGAVLGELVNEPTFSYRLVICGDHTGIIARSNTALWIFDTKIYTIEKVREIMTSK
jgi:hypothetical protein